MNKVTDSAGNWPEAAEAHVQKVSAMVPHLGDIWTVRQVLSNCARVMCLS